MEALIYSINNPAAERMGYVGSIRKFIVLWGLLPTYRVQYNIEPPQGAGENPTAHKEYMKTPSRCAGVPTRYAPACA
jgi:hypothetical protein